MFSPRVWGWSALDERAEPTHGVLPTRVGMVRSRRPRHDGERRSPHACGDGPHFRLFYFQHPSFSPRVWGWSGRGGDNRAPPRVLPTRVGMVRCCDGCASTIVRSPHACGDGPRARGVAPDGHGFSPRVWGWSDRLGIAEPRGRVLPTRVGMVRRRMACTPGGPRSPHACGDGPLCLAAPDAIIMFSPRVWGWSENAYAVLCVQPVLPTRVGMVRRMSRSSRESSGSPHACGDGPRYPYVLEPPNVFSPRVWGWSDLHRARHRPQPVLPTRVGMVR